MAHSQFTFFFKLSKIHVNISYRTCRWGKLCSRPVQHQPPAQPPVNSHIMHNHVQPWQYVTLRKGMSGDMSKNNSFHDNACTINPKFPTLKTSTCSPHLDFFLFKFTAAQQEVWRNRALHKEKGNRIVFNSEMIRSLKNATEYSSFSTGQTGAWDFQLREFSSYLISGGSHITRISWLWRKNFTVT